MIGFVGGTHKVPAIANKWLIVCSILRGKERTTYSEILPLPTINQIESEVAKLYVERVIGSDVMKLEKFVFGILATPLCHVQQPHFLSSSSLKAHLQLIMVFKYQRL